MGYEADATKNTQKCADASTDIDFVGTFSYASNNLRFSTCTLSLTSTNGQAAQTKAFTQEVGVTVSAAIPEGSKIVLTWDSAWGSTTASTCSATGLSNMASGTVPTVARTSATVVTITNFGAIASGSALGISC